MRRYTFGIARVLLAKRPSPSPLLTHLRQDPNAPLETVLEASRGLGGSDHGGRNYVLHRLVSMSETTGDIQAAVEGLKVIDQAASSGVEWSEQLVSLAVRAACAADSVDQLQQHYANCKSRGWLRHRTLSPSLRRLCRWTAADPNLMGSLNAVCADAAQLDIQLDEGDYEALLRTHRTVGSPLGTLHHILSKMAEEAPVATPGSGMAIREWAGTRYCREVVISPLGVCNHCGAKLVGMPFTSRHRTALLNTLREQVVLKRPSAARAFDGAARLLEGRPDVTAVVDGANVGYYGLTSWYPVSKRRVLERLDQRPVLDTDPRLKMGGDRSGGYVDVPPAFDLIDMVMKQLVERHGLVPIVILHPRHIEDGIKDPVFNPIINSWRAKRMLYAAPNGVYDDVLWLHCALYHTVPTDANITQGVKRVFVVTNDKMRDHLFATLNRTVLDRWRGRHQVQFSCSFENGKTEPVFEFPKPFTECTQYNAPISSWHVPYGTDEEDIPKGWLCIK